MNPLPTIARDTYGYTVARAALSLGLHEDVVERLVAFAESDAGPTVHPNGNYGRVVAGMPGRSLIGEARAECYRRCSMPPGHLPDRATPQLRRVSDLAFGVDVFAPDAAPLEARLDQLLVRWTMDTQGVTPLEALATEGWWIR